MMNDCVAPAREACRIAALRRYALLDTPGELAFDRLARLAAHALAAPIAMVSLVAEERVWFKAAVGVSLSEVPRADSLSSITILRPGLTIMLDTWLEPGLAGNPLVAGPPFARFYAGVPLVTPDGHAIGALCVVDTAPRDGISPAEEMALQDLAGMVMDQMGMRLETAQRERLTERTRLRERLLAADAEGATSQGALTAALGVVREAAGAMLCLLFRTAPDRRGLQLLGGTSDRPDQDEANLDALRRMDFNLENSLSGLVIRGEVPGFIAAFTPELLARYPGLRLAAGLGARAQLISPVSLGEDRYTLALSFRDPPAHPDEVQDLLREMGATLRPLLRRLRETESAALFRRAVDASGDAVIISEAQPLEGAGPRIRYVNQAFTQQTGYGAEEVVGRTQRLLDGAETTQEPADAIRAALAQQRPVRQEILSYRRDGTSFWADLNIAPVTDMTGWLTHWMVIQRDVTAQRTEAQALAERAAYFRHFFEQHPGPMWVYDRETLRFLEVNEAAIRTYGMSGEEFRQRTILDIRPPEDWPATREMVEKLSPDYMDTGPWRHITAQGAIRLVQTRGRVIQLHGRVAHLVVVWDVTERIEAERALRQMADELNGILASIGDGFFTLDAEGRFNYVNERARHWLNPPEAAALAGTEGATALPEGPEGALQQRLRAIQAKGATENFLHHDTAAGRWFDVTGYPAPGGGLTVYLRDVTAQRQREERLRLLEAIVDKLNDVILVTEAEPIDAPGPRIVFVNAAFERLTGYTPAEVLGRTPRLLQSPRTDRAELDRIRAALASWSPVRAELLNRTRSGREFWVELDIVPVADEAGWYTHWVAVERDVTERKHAQIKLEEQAALLDQSRDAIMVRSLDDRITYWNRSAERLYGWTAQEVQGRSVEELLYADPAAPLAAKQVLLRDGHWSGQMSHRRKNGATMIVEAHKTLLRDADGTPRAILAVNSDVTERIALEGQLRQAQRMEAVGQLTGGIAHDFNNLLTVVVGNAETLVDRLGEAPELRRIAALTLAAAERGAALTNRLLAFSRQQTLNPMTINVHDLLLGLEELIRRAVDERITLRITTTADLWPALIDPPQLETAVLNLCLNARDAMPLGGRMDIATSNFTLAPDEVGPPAEMGAGDYVVITVSDTGTGMPAAVVARAFEPFFTTKEVGKGSGLGLSMVYGFIKQSGGHVGIESQPGAGTTIRIYIPRAPGHALAPLPKPQQAPSSGGSERILLVEDDPLVREHAARSLRGLGYAVDVAGNGEEAVALLGRSGPYDLLFTDIVMPGGMAGHELAEAARRQQPGLRILFSSGYTEQSGEHEGWLMPGMLLLAKPYRLRALAEKIREALQAPA